MDVIGSIPDSINIYLKKSQQIFNVWVENVNTCCLYVNKSQSYWHASKYILFADYFSMCSYDFILNRTSEEDR